VIEDGVAHAPGLNNPLPSQAAACDPPLLSLENSHPPVKCNEPGAENSEVL